jgi:NIPSNAP protein
VIYDVTILSVRAGQTPAALERVEQAVLGADRGRLQACWYCEIGAVGDIMLIRGFRTAAELTAERERLVMDGDAFGVGDVVEGITSDTFLRFPFLPDMPAGKLGPFYEVRVYQTTRAGIPATIDLWREAVPHRVKISPLVTAMYAIDAALPRFMHIWPFPSLDARQALRQQAFDSGQWPPKGGLAHLRRFSSSIYLPARFSPLA